MGLPAVSTDELLEARVRAQGRKMRAGIDGGEIAVSGGTRHRAAVVRFEEFAYSFSSKA